MTSELNADTVTQKLDDLSKARAAEIATRLGETDAGPVLQIQKLVHYVGYERIMQAVEETFKIEAEGGMLTLDQTRRRTPGGVFFYVVKKYMDRTLIGQVFPHLANRMRAIVLDWNKRMDIIERLLPDTHGNITFLEVTLYGRPGKVEISGDTVVMVFDQLLEFPEDHPFPRGMVRPPATTQQYIIYMGILSWERIQKTLENPEDLMIIRGRLMLDDKAGLTVFALAVTTRDLERRKVRDQKNKEKAAQEKAAKAPKPVKAAPEKAVSTLDAAPLPVPSTVEVPTSMPPEVAEKYVQLCAAADTLRERIAAKTAKGQKAAMEEKLLQNTEKQIAGLKNQYP